VPYLPERELKTPGKGGMHDALIGATASGEANVLVTEDKDLRRKMKASSARCPVWSFAELMAFMSKEEE
jgi:hypothetical protein